MQLLVKLMGTTPFPSNHLHGEKISDLLKWKYHKHQVLL